jgi:outer membrane protein OmpA-like peptidoglycan-associated protein
MRRTLAAGALLGAAACASAYGSPRSSLVDGDAGAVRFGADAAVDRDGDGIPDSEDACPNMPGPTNADPVKTGCPVLIRVEPIRDYILEQVHFTADSAVILPDATRVLEAVETLLKKDTQITRLYIDGHASAHEKDTQRLSERRADAVRTWLVAHGVTTQLVAAGSGDTLPEEDDTRPEGRARNRRVEFRIDQGDR